MKMALNELNSLCRSALEGSGWTQGDYEDAADAAVWLQAMGFDGMEAINGLLGVARQEEYVVEPALLGKPGARVEPNTSCTGLAGCLLAFDLAWARATPAGTGTVRVSNALSPRLALYGLKSMCARGRRFDLSWTDRVGRHFAATSGHEVYPAYLGCNAQAGTTSLEIIVRCTTEVVPFDAALAAPQNMAGAIDAAELDARYRDALWRGIVVDATQVDRLIAWKSKVLVPASQMSRDQGAGGADDGF
ncbi:DUF3726 domain-containing protein [Burkholderia sp. S171]|uniref:DUF3726 domain-containing protein n=1 Tax=Burkholderia sp. S171 TaxID=1641860 RepID=UPI00131BBA6A|nr:DUF3726 domain-containing protein [Burkholderia sp. S171]